MRFIAIGAGPGNKSASRPWEADVPAVDSHVFVSELARDIRVDRREDECFHAYVSPKEVDALLGAPGTPWVDHVRHASEEAMSAA